MTTRRRRKIALYFAAVTIGLWLAGAFNPGPAVGSDR